MNWRKLPLVLKQSAKKQSKDADSTFLNQFLANCDSCLVDVSMDDDETSMVCYNNKKATQQDAQNDKHECYFYRRKSLTNRNLEIHLRLHTMEKFPVKKILQCPRTFVTENGRRVHNLLQHGTQEEKEECQRKQQSKILTRLRLPISCYFCMKISTEFGCLVAHMQIHTREVTLHTCSMCGETFRLKYNLTLHKILIHGNLQEKEAYRYKVRERSKTKQPLLCYFCGYTGYTRSNLKIHLRIHTHKHLPATCNTCRKRFKSPFYLKRHFTALHGSQKQKAELRLRMNQLKKKRTSVCYFCCLKLTDYYTMEKHMRQQHTKEVVPLDCKRCHKVYPGRELLRSHQRVVCYASNESKKKRHQKYLARKARVNVAIECYFCEKRLRRFLGLRNHIRKHTTEGLFKCGKCRKTFIANATLKKHIQVFH